MSDRDRNELSQEERRALAALPRSVEPARDLWPALEQRIVAEPQDFANERWWTSRGLRAAAIALAILGSGVLIGRIGSPPEKAPVVAEVERSEDDAPVAILPTDAEWDAASSQVLASLADSTSGVDPATAEIVRRNLEIIDDAVRDIRTALETDPSNAQLQKLLTAEYRRRSSLLRRATTDTPM